MNKTTTLQPAREMIDTFNRSAVNGKFAQRMFVSTVSAFVDAIETLPGTTMKIENGARIHTFQFNGKKFAAEVRQTKQTKSFGRGTRHLTIKAL